MRTALITVFLILLVGCQAQPQPETKPEVKPLPQISPPAPQPQQTYSPEFIRGYNDGYTGVWVAPAHWLLANEYRSGHAAGKKDKNAGAPHRFQK